MKMKMKAFVSYVLGFAIGLFLTSLLLFNSSVDSTNSPIESNRKANISKVNKLKKSIIETTIEDVKKIRILCFLTTRPSNHMSRAVHIKATWGKHCDKILFASTMTDVSLGSIGFNSTDDHGSIWGKVKLMLKHVYDNYIDEYDWFLKGDDDMFLITENMRYLLSAYSVDDPIYFGHKYFMPIHKRGYFSGGSGYVMSRKTVRIFVEKVLTNPEFYRVNNSDERMCHIETDNMIEDKHITVCLDHYNVYAGDSRDLLKRDRFFPFWPQAHLFIRPDPTSWYWQRKYYFNDEGLDCCSNYTISFHYINAPYQYTMQYLIYRLQTFGIKRRFPSPPKKKNFAEVTHILDAERFNKTLRGY